MSIDPDAVEDVATHIHVREAEVFDQEAKRRLSKPECRWLAHEAIAGYHAHLAANNKKVVESIDPSDAAKGLRPHERLALTLAKNFSRRGKPSDAMQVTILIETVERLLAENEALKS
jgi:hypothetical protein